MRTNNFREESHLYYMYIKDIIKYPLLTKKEEKVVLKKVQEGSSRAIERLVCSNLKFVINVAFMYRNQGLTLTELINEGNIGLIESAKRFDLNKNIRFISYAVWWIRQSITRSLSEKVRIVRISAEKELLLRRINKNQIKMKHVIGGGLRIDTKDLGEKMGLTKDKMDKLLEMGQFHSSLDGPLDSEAGNTLMDVIENTKTDSSDLEAFTNSQSKFLNKNLDRLSPQEQRVIRLYFGMSDNKALSLEDIGDIIGLSKERVRQIKEKGLANLRNFEMPRELLMAA